MLQEALSRAIPAFSLARQLAPRPAKKGSSLDRLAFWKRQHAVKRSKREAVREGVTPSYRFKIVGHDKDGIPIPRLTMLDGIRIDAKGQPRSKTYSYAGKR